MKKEQILALAVQSGFKLDWAISNCTSQFESFYHAAIESYKAELLKEAGEPVGLVTFVDGECYAELSDTAKLVEFDELFTSDQLAATQEQIANETAEAIAKMLDDAEVEETHYCMTIYEEGKKFQFDMVEAIRSGAWKEFKQS